jgi:hypothetical protein
MATIASLKVDLLADSTGLNKSLADALAKMQEFGARAAGVSKKLADNVASAGRKLQEIAPKMTEVGAQMSTKLTLPILAIGGAMVKAASDAEETSTKFAVVFRDVEQGAQQAFKTLRDEYGLSATASKQLLGDTGDLLTGFGFTGAMALDLATEVNKLAVDLASFTNFSGGAEGASKALTKALLGERESVKSLGISILEEDVQKQVAINTTNGLTFASERQAKAYATLQIAQAQSKNAIGDYARTQDGLANQTRLLQQRMNDLAVSFGEIMIPAVNKVVGRLTAMTESFRDLDPETKKIIIGIAGFVAVVGPTLFAIGKLTTAITTLTLAMAKNPATAIAIGLLAIASAAYIAIKGVGDLENALLKQSGVSTLTGSEDERKKLNALKDQIEAEKKLLEVRKQQSQSFQTRQQLQAGIDVLKKQIDQIDQSIAKSNILAFETDQLATSAEEAKNKLNDLGNGLGGTTTQGKYASGSISALSAQLEVLQAQFEGTASGMQRANLANQIRELEERITVLRSVLTPVTSELRMLNEMGMAGSDGFGGSEWDTQYEGVKMLTWQMRLLESATIMANQTAMSFTDSFGAGMANVIVQGQKLTDVLKNIGKLLLSSAIQTGIKLLLMGTSGFGVAGGTLGLLGGLFKPQVSAVPSAVMGAGTMQMSGSFKLQGTDLIMSVNRSQRQFR